jgi:hypothetical protein
VFHRCERPIGVRSIRRFPFPRTAFTPYTACPYFTRAEPTAALPVSTHSSGAAPGSRAVSPGPYSDCKQSNCEYSDASFRER